MLQRYTSYVIFAMSAGCFAIFLFLIVDLSDAIEGLAKDTITQKNEEANNELSLYFSPVITDIERTVELGKLGLYDSLSIEDFDLFFFPLLKSSKQLSSLMLAKSNGDEKMLLQLKDSWKNRVTFSGSKSIKPTIIEWTIKNGAINIERNWKSTKDYTPLNRPWYTGAIKSEGAIYWTKAYQFFTTKEAGITASKRWVNKNGDTLVFAFDILLKDLSLFTQNLIVSKNGMAFICTEDDRVLGLSKNSSDTHESTNKTKALQPLIDVEIPAIILSNNAWKAAGGGNKTYSFDIDGEKWWGSITEFKLGENTYRSGVIAPESDFLDEINQFRLVLFGSLSLVLFFTVVIAIISKKIKTTNLQLKSKNAEIKKQKNEAEKQRDYAVKLKNITETQKLIVEEKNKEITDSLNYATRIQNAIMPPDRDLTNYLRDGFIYYQPKDIVAGDFYWLKYLNESTKSITKEEHHQVLFAVADCTGHGVPGAMVSVICSNALNRSVREYGLVDPGEILNKTREFVIQSFEKSDEKMKDGMDIALCSFKRTNENDLFLNYAGANNSLFIVRSNNLPSIESSAAPVKKFEFELFTLYEIKANKQPIGMDDEQQPFTTHTVKMLKDDAIYLFSDGFVDQFGGSKGKKFMVKSFRELLIKVQHLSMNEQKTFIENVFNKWKGEVDQIDDVCVMGVKII